MEFLAIGKIDKQDTSKTKYVVEITEAEADMITGVAGKVHISGRYKPGVQVNVTAIYEKVEQINEKSVEIVAAAEKLKTDADDIINAIPLTKEV